MTEELEAWGDTMLPEKYDRDHPHYYCYLTNCTVEEMRGFLDHRGIETKDDYPATLLVAILRQDDAAIKSGKKKVPCNCCIEGQDDYDPEDSSSHFGCEQCPPHYDKKDTEFLKFLEELGIECS